MPAQETKVAASPFRFVHDGRALVTTAFGATATPGDDTGVTLEIRVKQGETWSPWLFMQSWGRVVFPPTRTIKFDGGAVDIDEITLTKPADAYQCRIGLIAFNRRWNRGA